MVPALDCLSNLNLSQDQLGDIQGSIVDRLASADLYDLPVVVKFLGQNVVPETVDELVKKMRQKLDFKSIAKLQRDQTVAVSQRRGGSQKGQGSQALILGIIWHCYIFSFCAVERFEHATQ